MTDIPGYDYLSQRASSWGTSTATAPRWQLDAACMGVNPRVFWPEDGDMRQAVALCGSCPVLSECLKDAWETGDYGPDAVFRAGLTGTQRKERRKRPVKVRHCDRCGSGFIGTAFSRYCGPACRRSAATHGMRRRRA